MSKKYLCIAAVLFAFIGLTGCEQESRVIGDTNSVRAAEIRQTHRDLWLGHIVLIQHFVVYNQTKNPAEQAAAERDVVANARQIAIAMVPFYGEARAERFFALLVDHVAGVKEYSGATVTWDRYRQNAALNRLAANADDIAGFLSGVNPHLSKEVFRGLIAAHGAHHVLQINLYKKKEYAQLEATWPMMREHAYIIADAVTTALVKQFPTEFS